MLRRCSVLVATLILIAAALRAESPGTRELALGKEALAHRDFRAAADHLTAATQTLDPQAEKEALADAWLQLGVVDLTGLDRASEALAAFRKSADLAASPSSAWLWAATAAEKLGRQSEAADLKARALAPPPAPEPPAAPEPVQAKAAAPVAPVPPVPETVQAKIPETAPEPVKAAAPSPPAAEKEAAPAPAPAAPAETAQPTTPVTPPAPAHPAPSAFQHFFGPKERKAPPAPSPAAAPPPAVSATSSSSSSTTTPPTAAPAAAPAAASSSAPSSPPPVAKEGAAFQHLFGENRPGRPEGAREAQAEGPEARTAKEEKARSAAGSSPHLDALQILFGEKKKVVRKGDGKAPEPKKDDGI